METYHLLQNAKEASTMVHLATKLKDLLSMAPAARNRTSIAHKNKK